MNPDWLLAARLANQHVTAPGTGDPGELVSYLGAVQSQDYGQSLWALGLRIPAATTATVEDAIRSGAILRTWPMRGTIHFVPGRDARWMVSLLALRRIRQMMNVYQKIGLTDQMLSRAAEIVAAALAGGNRIQRRDLYAILAEHGVDCSASPHGSRGGHILGYLSMQGLLCLGPLDGRQPTFVLLDEWVPASAAPAEPMAELAIRYFISHGPATAKDFGWWSGLTLAEIRHALDLAGPALTVTEVEGQTYWLGAGRQAPDQSPAGAYLLPAFDEYTVAYRDRSAVMGDRQLPQGDLLNPVMVLDGRAVGVWRVARTSTAATITLGPFDGVSQAEVQLFEQPCQQYGAFAGLPVRIASGDASEVRRMRWP